MRRMCIKLDVRWESSRDPEKMGPGWVARGLVVDGDGDSGHELVAIEAPRSASPATLAALARREFPGAEQLAVDVHLK